MKSLEDAPPAADHNMWSGVSDFLSAPVKSAPTFLRNMF
jgi:hypothetical protein